MPDFYTGLLRFWFPVRQFMSLGKRIAQVSGEARETSFLFQRCSLLVQRFNAVLLHDDSLPVMTERTDDHTRFCIFF